VAVVKVFFHPNVKVELAIAQITAIMQTIYARPSTRHFRPEYFEVRRFQRTHPAVGLEQ
jgi:hypothetical protein